MAGVVLHHIGLSCDDPLEVERFYTKHFGFKRGRVYAPGTNLDGIEILFKGGQVGRTDLFGSILKGSA